MKLWKVLLLEGLLLCALALVLTAVGQANAGPTVFVSNESTLVTDVQVQDALPAFQGAVSGEFAQAWGADATLFFSNTPPVGSWRLVVSDYSFMEGAIGFHELVDGAPVGRAFARTAAENGLDWQVTFTHELFEMLADPWLNRISVGTRLWLVEVCDPVENDAYAYTRIGASGEPVKISDFVLPSWYRKKAKGPYDFEGYVTSANQLLPGGFVSYWLKGWQQLNNFSRILLP